MSWSSEEHSDAQPTYADGIASLQQARAYIVAAGGLSQAVVDAYGEVGPAGTGWLLDAAGATDDPLKQTRLNEIAQIDTAISALVATAAIDGYGSPMPGPTADYVRGLAALGKSEVNATVAQAETQEANTFGKALGESVSELPGNIASGVEWSLSTILDAFLKRPTVLIGLAFVAILLLRKK